MYWFPESTPISHFPPVQRLTPKLNKSHSVSQIPFQANDASSILLVNTSNQQFPSFQNGLISGVNGYKEHSQEHTTVLTKNSKVSPDICLSNRQLLLPQEGKVLLNNNWPNNSDPIQHFVPDSHKAYTQNTRHVGPSVNLAQQQISQKKIRFKTRFRS